MFHEDVVQVVRKRLAQEEDLPDEQRPTALARSYYLKVFRNKDASFTLHTSLVVCLYTSISFKNYRKKELINLEV